MKINIPNTLTAMRILLLPLIIILFYSDIENARPFSCLLFAIISITDWLDGYLARALNQESELGAFLDPVADKLLVIVVLLLLLEDNPQFWLTLPIMVIICREVIISALREWMAKLGETRSTAVNFIGKIKTTSQMLALGFMLYQQPLLSMPNYEIGIILLYASAILTIYSMFFYIYKSLHIIKKTSN
ncbi:MAG: CDP-diacylglycerol--glycerol-3-phosphate 3-phosphatidyltransferase [Gammaproteobacteria bacterium]|nr:MAG: CDP-diacylglycerol--glycerol-3-phosphate 3-phosphatidyltransferase [Gammaproteobacteria bacterium]